MDSTKKKWVVGITDYIAPPANIETEAFPEAEFRFLPDYRQGAESGEAWKTVDALLAWNLPVGEEAMALAAKCRIVVRYGVGYDAVDEHALARRGIPLCNTPDYGTEEVADAACAMILTIQRRILQYDRNCRHDDGRWQENLLKPHDRTSEQALGLVGVGRIGTAVVNRMKPFRYRILGYDPYQPSGHEKGVGYERVDSLEDLLRQADIVTLHCPCTEETRGMVDTRFIQNMKPGASLVNTARGGIVANLGCLEEALRSGQLRSAALDVMPSEPPEDHPLLSAWREDAPWLRGRLIINPHAAYYSERGWYEMRYKAAETMRRYLLEGRLRNQIPPPIEKTP